MKPRKVSVVIPTFRRGEALLETLARFHHCRPQPKDVIVVDQTSDHPAAIARELARLAKGQEIVLLRRPRPSIPAAMNAGLLAAAGEIVLFVDDDVVPVESLVGAHTNANGRWPDGIVAGQVLQPGEIPEPLEGECFAFRSTVPQEVGEVIGCNFSVARRLALEIGGFDENFVRAAYRFEREFCDRARRAGARIHFEPAASLHHLRIAAGGTRAHGDHLRTFRPSHAVGEYYYLLGARGRKGRWSEVLLRPLRAVATRHHLRRPWWAPATICAESLGLIWAFALAARGPRLLATASPRGTR